MARPLDHATRKRRHKNLSGVLGENAVDYSLQSRAGLLSITRVRIEVHRLQGLALDPVRKFRNGAYVAFACLMLQGLGNHRCPSLPFPFALVEVGRTYGWRISELLKMRVGTIAPLENVITAEFPGIPRAEDPVLTQFSQRLQKCDQVCFLLRRQAEIEALIIELNSIAERVGAAIVEVWCTCRQSTQYGPLHFPDIGALAGNQCSAKVGHSRGQARCEALHRINR